MVDEKSITTLQGKSTTDELVTAKAGQARYGSKMKIENHTKLDSKELEKLFNRIISATDLATQKKGDLRRDAYKLCIISAFCIISR